MFDKTRTFMKEVKVELKKVTWPSRREVIGSTTVVVFAVAVFGGFLGMVDAIFSKGLPTSPVSEDVWIVVAVVFLAGVIYTIYSTTRS